MKNKEKSKKKKFHLQSVLIRFYNPERKTNERKMNTKYNFVLQSTVKLGYNELGYNEHPDITNKEDLVGLGNFMGIFSRL